MINKDREFYLNSEIVGTRNKICNKAGYKFYPILSIITSKYHKGQISEL
jgi:hypothetical protein